MGKNPKKGPEKGNNGQTSGEKRSKPVHPEVFGRSRPKTRGSPRKTRIPGQGEKAKKATGNGIEKCTLKVVSKERGVCQKAALGRQRKLPQ